MHFDRVCPLNPGALEHPPAPRIDAETIEQSFVSAIWAISHRLWNRWVHILIGNTGSTSDSADDSYFA